MVYLFFSPSKFEVRGTRKVIFGPLSTTQELEMVGRKSTSLRFVSFLMGLLLKYTSTTIFHRAPQPTLRICSPQHLNLFISSLLSSYLVFSYPVLFSIFFAKTEFILNIYSARVMHTIRVRHAMLNLCLRNCVVPMNIRKT